MTPRIINNTRTVNGGKLCDIVIDGSDVIIQMFLSAKYTSPTDGLQGYRPSAVYVGGIEKWSFRTCGADLTRGQVAELYEYDRNCIIVVQDRTRILSVTPVMDLANRVKVNIAGIERYIGGTSVEMLLEIKEAIADASGLTPAYTKAEQDLIKSRNEVATAASRERAMQLQAARASDSAQKRAAASAEKQKKIAAILARTTISGTISDGRTRYGIPVIGDEWQCLPHGKYCISVVDRQPYEAFMVSREGSNHARQVQRVFVSPQNVIATAKQTDTTVVAICEKTFSVKGVRTTVMVFASMDDVKHLRAAGLNSGTHVAVSSDGGKSGTVYAVYKDNIKTVGEFKPKAQVT